MNKLLSRILTLTLLLSLLISNLPIAQSNSVYAAAANDKQDEKKNGESEKHKAKLKDAFSLSDDDIQGILDQGFTLDEAEAALKEQQETGGELKDSLDKVKPRPVNKSKEAKSTITSNLGSTSYESPMFTAADTAPPVPDYSYVDTKGDQAPYSVRLDQETVSTLSGSLSLQAGDLSLPGRNGLGFTLARSYDSGSSQFNQLVTYGSSNGTVQPYDEKQFPIGKGWSWNISSIEFSGSNKFLHLGGAGTYKIDASNNLVGYAWKDLTFATSTATVNGQTAAYVLTTLQKVKQYFNASGQLIQIADAWGNYINFTYTSVPTYGTVLTTITDAIGNSINISYSATSVVLTKGSQTVTYYKTTQNGKELLSQVVDPIGRVITYDYNLQDAQFNLLGTTPNTSNPYALLTGVTHPTGAKSVYSYQPTPTVRYIGASAVNQVFKVLSREDQVTKSDSTIEHDNHKDFTYSGDMSSAWTSVPSFSTTINDGLTNTTFNNKKTYIDDNTPAAYYNLSIVATAIVGTVTYTNTTNYTYDEVNRYPYPITTNVSKTYTGNGTPFTLGTSKAYDQYGNVTSVTDPNNVTTTYSYDANHLLVGVSQPISASKTQYTEYVRDATYFNVTTTRVRDGNVTGTVMNETKNTAYDAYGNATQTQVLRDAGLYTTINTIYNNTAPYLGAFPTQQTVSVTDADNASSTISKQFDYDTTNGKLMSFTDGNTNVTSYQYDALGRVTKATHPDSSFIMLNYLDYTNQIQQTDESGVQTQTTWNALGWKINAGILDGGIYKNKATYEYDQYGRMLNSYDALGNKTNFGYDQWSRQNSITYPDLKVATVTFDDIANTKTSTDAEGYASRESYDKLGRSVKKEEKKNASATWTTLATYTFDNAGNVLTANDALSPANVTTYGYDVLGQLSSVSNQANVTSTAGVATLSTQTTSYLYNYFGKLTQTTLPDNKTKLNKYDELGRLIQTTDANSKVEKFYYDANSNQVKLLDRNGNRFKYTFDNRNFLKKKEIVDVSWNPLAGEETISFGYDLAGRRTSMVDGTGTTGYAYSAATGALSTQTYPDGKTIKYDYDAAGNRFVMNDPFGVNTYYHYDSRNRLDIVAPSADFLNNPSTTDFDAKYTYYNNSLLKQSTQRNGVTSNFGYDGLRITSLTEKKSDGTTLNSFAYTYDNNGNEKTKTENSTTNNFNYDQLNRIQTSDQFNETYGYDNRGNRTYMTTNNPFESPDATRTFDKRDRLTNVALTSGGNVSYKYNGDGLLWERTENGQTTRYYWDGDQVIAEANVVGGVATLKARYIRGQGLVAREDGQGKAYYLQNGHGDVVNLMDSTGMTKLNSYNYDIFGNIVSQQENLPQPFKYSGEMMDDKVGLQYLRARWYDPSMGRFVGEDSYEGQIDNPLSQNRFTYVSNNPLVFVDPSGHWCVSADESISHPGECSSSTSTYSDDMDHDGNTYQDSNQIGPGLYHYPVEDRYLRWMFLEDNSAYNSANDATKAQLRTMAFKKSTAENWDLVIYGFAAGVDSLLLIADVEAFMARKDSSNSSNCFVEGTLITTDRGQVPIEDIKVGDKVLSKNESTGEVTYKNVTQLFQHETEQTIKIHINDEIIETTTEHRFWVKDRGWVIAGDLKAGDILVTSKDGSIPISKVEVINNKKRVYNFEVEDFHTYFVSKYDIWVHNMCAQKSAIKDVSGVRGWQDTGGIGKWMKDQGYKMGTKAPSKSGDGTWIQKVQNSDGAIIGEVHTAQPVTNGSGGKYYPTHFQYYIPGTTTTDYTMHYY